MLVPQILNQFRSIYMVPHTHNSKLLSVPLSRREILGLFVCYEIRSKQNDLCSSSNHRRTQLVDNWMKPDCKLQHSIGWKNRNSHSTKMKLRITFLLLIVAGSAVSHWTNLKFRMLKQLLFIGHTSMKKL